MTYRGDFVTVLTNYLKSQPESRLVGTKVLHSFEFLVCLHNEIFQANIQIYMATMAKDCRRRFRRDNNSALLSISFLTVIPLLKVMMGQEGLHGWIDRKECRWRYGLEFYVPEVTDFADSQSQDTAYSLLVAGVDKESLAMAAGFKRNDRIFAVNTLSAQDQTSQIPYPRLLQEIATTDQNELTMQLKQFNKDGTLEHKTLKLNTLRNINGVDRPKWSTSDLTKRAIKMALIERAQWAVGFLPRQQTAQNKIKAVVFIMLAMAIVTIIRCMAKFFQDYLAEKIVHVGINHLREDIFGHIMDMPLSFFANERPSDSVSRIIRDTSVMGSAIKVMFGKAIREPLNALFMLSFAMLLDWQLTLIFLCGTRSQSSWWHPSAKK